MSEEIRKYDDTTVSIFAPKHLKMHNRHTNTSQYFSYPISEIKQTFRHSDLLLMVSDNQNHTYGFIGEVEGLHGENLFRSSYWDGIKGKYTTFAIGASDRKRSSENVQLKDNIVLLQDEKERFILHFANSTHFIKSFNQAINNIELCLDGHFSNIGSIDESHQSIINLIKKNWTSHITTLIENLEELISYDVDRTEFYYKTIEDKDCIYKPSPIVLSNNIYLQKLIKTE